MFCVEMLRIFMKTINSIQDYLLCIRIDQTQHSSLCQQTKRGRYSLCNASVRLNGRERVMSIFKVALLTKGTETTSCKDNM